MNVDARRLYGVGILVLGLGTGLFAVAQLLVGPQSTLFSLVELIMAVTLVWIGSLVVTDSDRLSESTLSDRVQLLIGVLGTVLGLFLLLGGAGLLLAG